jgi:hypothetical protein
VRDDDEEIVEVRVDLPADVCELARADARKRGMALEDYLSVLIRCDIEGTVLSNCT